MWAFPNETCPDLNNTIILTRNADKNCGHATGPCANSFASNQNQFDGYCLTLSLSLRVPSASAINQMLVQCFVMYDNSTDLQPEGNAIFLVPVPGRLYINFTSNYITP